MELLSGDGAAFLGNATESGRAVQCPVVSVAAKRRTAMRRLCPSHVAGECPQQECVRNNHKCNLHKHEDEH